jgi:Mlc titration factor MtfA (ptsG expression regulator)
MPFDTTYHLPLTDHNLSTTITSPGGIDTDIYLSPGEHIPHAGIMQKILDSIIDASSQQRAANNKDDDYKPGTAMVIAFISIFFFVLIFIRRKWRRQDTEPNDVRSEVKPSYLTYYGDELDFSDTLMTSILEKYFPYFYKLEEKDRKKFLYRVNDFMSNKTFLIHDRIGFREMPVLISAAAIQLTFGLKKYLLPNFTRIHIYPQEYVAAATLHIIEGNVQGKTINFSWKHFLDGFRIPDDGQNVGLHEMAHALYSQTFIIDENADGGFESNYHEFNSSGKKVFDAECSIGTGLYSDYAKTNFQEFWAESIELFFEKPLQLRTQYRELYTALCEVLNQDPANNIVRLA